jgi:hypothetical protein
MPPLYENVTIRCTIERCMEFNQVGMHPNSRRECQQDFLIESNEICNVLARSLPFDQRLCPLKIASFDAKSNFEFSPMN